LSIDLYGLRVSGANPYPDPPLLQVDHVEIGIRIVSVIQRTWYFDRLKIDHPVAWVVVDKNGRSNLPKIKGTGSGHMDVFQLGIRHALLDRGEIYYNDRPSALAADLHHLEFRASFNSLRTMYGGKLTYRNGNLVYRSIQSFLHDFDVEFEATPTAFKLMQAKIKVEIPRRLSLQF
jgi:translocation and assembly module TamB